jgi:exopolyphosphatase/guanosine-5'-triphosphate,3'-diphosphate pyrophosphatase
MGAGIDLQASQGWFKRHPTMMWWLDKEYEWWDEVGVTFRVRSCQDDVTRAPPDRMAARV